MKRRIVLRVSLAIVALVLASCGAKVKVTSSWTDPSFADRSLGKMMVLGVTASRPRRQYFETEFTRELRTRGVDAVGAYMVFPVGRELLVDDLKAAVAKNGFDTVLITHVVRRDVSYVEFDRKGRGPVGDPTDTFDGGYNSARATSSAPAITAETSNMRIETWLYDASSEQRVWKARSQVFLPPAVTDVTHKFARTVARRLTDELNP